MPLAIAGRASFFFSASAAAAVVAADANGRTDGRTAPEAKEAFPPSPSDRRTDARA